MFRILSNWRVTLYVTAVAIVLAEPWHALQGLALILAPTTSFVLAWSAIIPAALYVCYYKVWWQIRQEAHVRQRLKDIESHVAGVPIGAHNFQNSPVTMDILASLKLRLGTPPDTNANRLAARRWGLEYLKEITREGAAQHGMRLSHQQRHLTHAINWLFVPDADEVAAAGNRATWTWRRRQSHVAHEQLDFAVHLLILLLFGLLLKLMYRYWYAGYYGSVRSLMFR
jgi:hypothetical protein